MEASFLLKCFVNICCELTPQFFLRWMNSCHCCYPATRDSFITIINARLAELFSTCLALTPYRMMHSSDALFKRKTIVATSALSLPRLPI